MRINYRKAAAAALLAAVALFAGCGGAAGGSASSASAAPVHETMRPRQVRQVVAYNNETARTVMWQMDDQKDETLEYRKKGTNDISSTKATSVLLKGNQGIEDSYVYTARLDNLTKGTDYEYRTREGNSVSKWFPLHTEDGKGFKMLVTSDSQSADYSGWKQLFQDAVKRNPDISFFVDCGDLVDNGQDEYQWQAWLSDVEPTIAYVPVAPVQGNHEAYSLQWKMALPERYVTHFNLPSNGDKDLQNHYYSFDWGDVHFTVLDTQLVEEGEWHPDLYEKQLAWAEKDLAATKKKWKVVLMHKDVLQYSFADENRGPRPEGFSEEGETFMPLFDRMGVDLVLSAHLHTYRDRGRIYNFKRDTKGPRYIILGLCGDVRYPGLWKDHALDEYVAPQPETDNYNIFEAKDDELIVTGYLPDGTELHRAVVRK